MSRKKRIQKHIGRTNREKRKIKDGGKSRSRGRVEVARRSTASYLRVISFCTLM